MATIAVSGNPIVITDASATNAYSLLAALEAIQPGSGDPYLPGKGGNLLIVDAVSGSDNGVLYTVNKDSNGNVLSVTANGLATANSKFLFSLKNQIPLSEAGNGVLYYYSGCPTGYDGKVRLALNFIGNDTGSGLIGSVSSDATNTQAYIDIVSGTTVNNAVFRPFLCLNSQSDKTFRPYSNIRNISGVNELVITREGPSNSNVENVTISMGEAGTVYGGTLDVTTGLLTVTWSGYNLPIASMTDGNYPGWTDVYDDGVFAVKSQSTFPNEYISNIRSGVDRPDMKNIGFFINNQNANNVIYLGETNALYGMTGEEWKSKYPDFIFQCAIKRATPLVYQLTPAAISLLRGYNKISSSNSGEMTLNYYQALFDITLPSDDWASTATQAYPGTEVSISYNGNGIVNSIAVVKVEGLENVPVTNVAENEWKFTMPDGDVGVSANVDEPSSITLNSNSGGTITADKDIAFVGDTVTLTVTPEHGYYVYNIASAEVSLTKVNDTTYTFVMPNIAVAVTVAFAQHNYANIIVEPANGGVIRAKPTTAYEGNTVSLTVETMEGYTFQGLSVTRDNRMVDTVKVDDTHYTFTVVNLPE